MKIFACPSNNGSEAMELDEYIDIVRTEITPSDDEDLIREIFLWYIDRTRSHIASVREFGRKAVKFLKDEDWCCLLRANLIRHDHDKTDDSVFIAHYAPYIVKRYCDSGLQDRFELNDGYEKMWNEQYCIQHCKDNGHHVEGWDEKYDYNKESNPPYSAESMPMEYLAEMCCDWCAVGREQGNTAKGWFGKVNGKRFIFTKQQQEFIVNLLNAIEG